jgi:hypothetical protein
VHSKGPTAHLRKRSKEGQYRGNELWIEERTGKRYILNVNKRCSFHQESVRTHFQREGGGVRLTTCVLCGGVGTGGLGCVSRLLDSGGGRGIFQGLNKIRGQD